MNILVTGAHGFVGLNVVRRLAEDGHQVIASGRSEPDEWVTAFLDDVNRNVEHRAADLGQHGTLQQAMSGTVVDAVVHTAVITATTHQVEKDDAANIVHVNVGGTIEALEAAKNCRATRFVYVSSPSAIGPVAQDTVIDERVMKRPDSLYGISKDASEEIVRRYGYLHELSVASVRIAQPYGPGERRTSSRIRTSPVYEWILDAEAGRTLPTGPVNRARDWTYIDDTALGIATLATADSLEHDLYHLSYDHLVTVEDILSALRRRFPEISINERPSHMELNPNIAGTSVRRPLDNARFAREFSWSPSTNYSTGMQRYLDWWDSFPVRASDS